MCHQKWKVRWAHLALYFWPWPFLSSYVGRRTFANVCFFSLSSGCVVWSVSWLLTGRLHVHLGRFNSVFRNLSMMLSLNNHLSGLNFWWIIFVTELDYPLNLEYAYLLDLVLNFFFPLCSLPLNAQTRALVLVLLSGESHWFLIHYSYSVLWCSSHTIFRLIGWWTLF